MTLMWPHTWVMGALCRLKAPRRLISRPRTAQVQHSPCHQLVQSDDAAPTWVMGTMCWLKQVARCQFSPKVPRQPTPRGRAYSTPDVSRPTVTWLWVGVFLALESLQHQPQCQMTMIIDQRIQT